MTLYLIAHKVRGEPAFDIARKACGGEPPCQPNCGLWDGEQCLAQDWWQIPTSGHRAYPYWSCPLDALGMRYASGMSINEAMSEAPCPDPWPDHYACNDRDHKPLPADVDIRSILGNLFAPRPTVRRRF